MTSRPRPRPSEAAVWPVITSAVAGGLALVALLVAARELGPVAYADFAVLWGCFFGVGGAFAGLQQEVTRSMVAEPERGARSDRLVVRCIAIAAPVAVAAAAATALLTGRASDGVAIGIGLLGLAVMTTIGGALVAEREWRYAAVVLLLDAVARTGAVLACIVWAPPGALAPAVVVGALSWVLLLTVGPIRRALSTRATRDRARFAWRAAAAMAATASASLLIAGYPFLLDVFARRPLDGGDGVLLASMVLVRSPLLMLVYAYRPLLLRTLLAAADVRGATRSLLARCLALGALLTAAAWGIGPVVVRGLAGAAYDASGADLAVIAASGVLLGATTVSGIALVALDRHGSATAGWVGALVVTVLVMLVLPDPGVALVVGTLAGPSAGLALHATVLWRSRAQSTPSENADSRS